MKLEGKDVAVLGAGGSGLAAAALALGCGASVAAYDSGDPEELAEAVKKFAALGVVLTTGKAALSPEKRFDLAVISPGIDERWPIGKAFRNVSSDLIGEIEFAWQQSRIPVIAITGTNGKTTTTGLITHMLNGCGLKAVAAGNIGYAYSEAVGSGVAYDWIVLEVSSFQLETIRTFQPTVSIWTNFAPDHMDRYSALEDYRAAKMRIFENHGDGSTAIVKKEDALPIADAVTFSAFETGGNYYYESGRILVASSDVSYDFRGSALHGLHNAENVMMALAVGDRLGLDRARVSDSIDSFRPPEHRCEAIAEQDGVIWVNDSKSTNIHSLESALRGQDSPVVLICGGKEKGLDFGELTGLVSASVKNVICIGETAEKVSQIWENAADCYTADSVEEAVAMAARWATSGDVVLFSPGTSSFDMFSGYVERGNRFREAVQQHLS
ncbi:MAG: UDP-N-acetylmuramoyl-L-alanine--D-glutamate ligase [Verrucomicrobiales bacterium]|nr:UDP-N-acetylmuramoyl-L-alanine--D-glutamate ligase [Verrucomicrobiales bacterium]